MSLARTRRLSPVNYWPGFVDALAAVLMVVVFLVMVFALAQFSFSALLSQSEGEVVALEDRLLSLQSEVTSLQASVATERSRFSALEAALDLAHRDLAVAREEAVLQQGRANDLALRLTDAEDRMARSVAELSASEARILELVAAMAVVQQSLGDRDASLATAGERRAELEDQLARLNDELAKISGALNAAEQQTGSQQGEIESLSAQLAQALASQVEQLAGYRSEFFGRLRELLGDQEGIEIVGDRFVLQSEILFPSGEADLGNGGRLELMRLAAMLRQISAEIPSDIDWVIRVGGHTDVRPISTPEFPSNWALSAARALEVVMFLSDEGIPPERLMAAGFGEFQPRDNGADDDALARNRRIEFKLTER